jgi:hypothetical protein
MLQMNSVYEFNDETLQSALKSVTSMIERTENIREKLSKGSPQMSLNTN